MKKIILVNLAILLAGLVLLELVFGSWFSHSSPMHQFTKPRNVQKSYKAGLSGQPELSRYTIDEHGLRGLRKGLGDIFILTVGGSTTNQKYIDDDLTFEELLEKAFRANGRDVDIVSAGIDGQSTFGHLKNFPFWFDKLDGFSPRYILYYVGVNDLYIIDELPGYDEMKRDGLKAKFKHIAVYVADRSALYAMGRIAANLIRPPRVVHFGERWPIPFSPEAWTTHARISNYRTPAIEKSLDKLQQRLAALAEETRKRGAEPIFVTQRSSLWTEREGKIWGSHTMLSLRHPGVLKTLGGRNGVDRYWLERIQAMVIMDACREAEGICIDLGGSIRLDPEVDFYDPVHTTPSGSRKIAQFLYPYLKTLP